MLQRPRMSSSACGYFRADELEYEQLRSAIQELPKLPRRENQRDFLFYTKAHCFPDQPTRRGAFMFFNMEITLSAVMRPVLGFSVGIFSMDMSNRAESDSTTI